MEKEEQLIYIILNSRKFESAALYFVRAYAFNPSDIYDDDPCCVEYSITTLHVSACNVLYTTSVHPEMVPR